MIQLKQVFIEGVTNVFIKPTMGELMRPIVMDEETFLSEQAKIKGMNEHSARISISTENNISQRVYEHFNLGECPSTDTNTLRYLNCIV